ncbi:MAG TPA: hypothetical protein VHN39_15435 [Phenylobacterium sp.]|nr:hypothetical protein [Phenylobacterium sp.]
MFRTNGIPTFVYPLTLLAICILAIWRGGRHERIATFGLLGGWIVTVAAYRVPNLPTEYIVLAADLSLLALLIWVAMKSPAWWPIFAAGFHLLAILTHVAKDLDRQLGTWAYISAQIIWGYLLAITIGVGSWRHPVFQLATSDDPTADPGATRR